jgi:hypothetical protein
MTITASLLQWSLRGNDAVQGTIARSISNKYKDGDQYLFLNGKLTHYCHAEGFWPDHFTLSTNTGDHFFLSAKEQTIDETSMA